MERWAEFQIFCPNRVGIEQKSSISREGIERGSEMNRLCIAHNQVEIEDELSEN